MCGRFTLTIDLQGAATRIMGSQPVQVPSSIQSGARYNIAPTQNIATLLNDDGLRIEMQRWGLVPSWAKDETIGSRMINARSETLAEKPSFKRLLSSRRCLILADGFYEWTHEPGSKSKTPMYITMNDGAPFTFAGLWDSWKHPDGPTIRTCTIITTTPNELMASIHNRMPVILGEDARALWLDNTLRDTQALSSILTSYPQNAMTARPVSRQVNDPRHDGAELIA